MRTLRITLLASLAGWLAWFLVGTVGGFVAAWMQFGPAKMWQTLTVEGTFLSEGFWAFGVAIAILPGSLFFAAPLVFRALERSFWHPFKAACIGGGLGLVGLIFWFAVVSLFTVPVNWSRPGEGLAAVAVCVPTALAIGMTTGCGAALMGRTHAGPTSTAAVAAGDEQPPPVPYEY